MLAAILATSAAILYGTADYLGGVATRRASALTVALFSHLSGAATVALLLLFTAGSPEAHALAQGALAGLASGLGLALFYRAMTMGAISVAVAVASATSACVPAIYGLAAGERPNAVAIAGVGVAVLAIVLVSREAPGGEVASGKGKAGWGRGVRRLLRAHPHHVDQRAVAAAGGTGQLRCWPESFSTSGYAGFRWPGSAWHSSRRS
ncbi:EamA family transporter [Nonomuraea sp. NPDC003804]|uniref:EamA family transporter n=1 Tax=Nonomuraea sp. NPDC003804 TaxID=3154547 RepID=UPI0033AEC703